MNEIEKQLFDECIQKYGIADISYKILGRLLDEKYLEERIKLFNIKHMYIYGGSYMAVQLYRIGKNITDVKGVVDKSGKIMIDDKISVLTLEEFKGIYNDEMIVITSIRYFQEIKKDIRMFAAEDNIMSIAELMMGAVRCKDEFLV